MTSRYSTSSAATAQVISAPRPKKHQDRARGAYVALLVFMLVVYSSLPQLIPATDPWSPGKVLIAVSAAALAWSCILGRRPFRWGVTAGGGALYLFFLLLSLSPLWSLWPRFSLDAVGESLKYLVAFIVTANVVDSRERLRGAATMLVVGALFPAIGAVHGYLSGTHLVEGTRAAWIGVFANPNFLAYHLVLSTPIALALREGGRKHSALRLAYLAIVCLFAVAILLTGSRGGAVGMGAVLLFWFARGLARGRLALGAACALAIAVLMTPGGPWNRTDTKTSLSGQVDLSAQGRLDAWETALRIVSAHPGLGVGAGAFILGYEIYAPGKAGPARTAHNSFLMIAAELGLPALVLFLAALVGAFVKLGRTVAVLREDHSGDAAVAIGLQTALFGFVVCSLTGGYTFTWPLYFILGLAVALAALELWTSDGA